MASTSERRRKDALRDGSTERERTHPPDAEEREETEDESVSWMERPNCQSSSCEENRFRNRRNANERYVAKADPTSMAVCGLIGGASPADASVSFTGAYHKNALQGEEREKKKRWNGIVPRWSRRETRGAPIRKPTSPTMDVFGPDVDENLHVAVSGKDELCLNADDLKGRTGEGKRGRTGRKG